MGSFPGWVIPKTLKMEPVAFSLGAQLMRLEQGQCFITGLLNGCRSWFVSRLGHTKDFKNGTCSLLAWCSAYEIGAGPVLHNWFIKWL